MASPDPNLKRALAILNDALARDAHAMTQLINARISCDERLSKHSTVQTGVYAGQHKVGVLGLINGVLGYKHGGIGAEGEVDTRTGLFKRVRRFVHTKSGIDVHS
jgi:hypothetical protein